MAAAGAAVGTRCPRCTREYATPSPPKVLQCGHTFCADCCVRGVRQGERGRPHDLFCYTCGERTQVLKSKGVNGLATNLELLREVEQRAAAGKTAKAQHEQECAGEYRSIDETHRRLLCNDPELDLLQTAVLLHKNFDRFINALLAAPPDAAPCHDECDVTWLLMLFSTYLVKAPPLPHEARTAFHYDMTQLHKRHPSELVRTLSGNLLQLYWEGAFYSA
eukprot:TRINITY_DN6702_c0_g4_i1.p1 TRINITY_DN6702_c0_g4~~TRINITY_DN6702_c0_g4_i1.p1  ORF type:complete len:220 (+),score=79.09 TRINITY_DN6702_c0_g4_i1:95-754(+)